MKENNQLQLNQITLDSHESFEILYRRYFERLYAFAYKVVRDESIAKDLVQKVFLKLWEKRKALNGNRIESLLFTMLRNQCISYLRHDKVVENRQLKLNSVRKMEELYRIDFVRDQPLLLIEQELQEEIGFVMSSLPPKCRKVFQMSRVDRLTNAEIAKELDLHIKSVEKHISRALKSFYKHFETKVSMPFLVLLITFICDY